MGIALLALSVLALIALVIKCVVLWRSRRKDIR